MQVSGKTFVFLFGTVFLAIVLASLTSDHLKRKMALAMASAESTAEAQAAGVTE